MQSTEQQVIDYLYDLYGTDGEARSNQHDQWNVVYGFQHESRYRQTDDERKRNHFPYIAYEATRFVDHISKLRAHVDGPAHFVDIGCGVGDKVAMARGLCGCDTASGIEYSEYTYELARKYVGHLARALIRGDAFEQTYDQYNLLYMYCPIARVTTMRQLFRRVCKAAPEGAVIVDVGWSIYFYQQYADRARYSWMNAIIFTHLRDYLLEHGTRDILGLRKVGKYVEPILR